MKTYGWQVFLLTDKERFIMENILRNLRQFPLEDSVAVSEDDGAGRVSAKVKIPILHNEIPRRQ